MIKRTFIVENFKSIKSEYLELNHLASSEESFGGVITLIGPNNSGKSNLLQALTAFSNNEFPTDVIREEEGILQKEKLELAISLTVDNDSFKLKKNLKGVFFNDKVLGDKNLSSIIPFYTYETFLAIVRWGQDDRTRLAYFLNNLINYFDHPELVPDYEKNSQLRKIVMDLKQKIVAGNYLFTDTFLPLAKFLSTDTSRLFNKEFADSHQRAMYLLVNAVSNPRERDGRWVDSQYISLIFNSPSPSDLNTVATKINEAEKGKELEKSIATLPTTLDPKILIYNDKINFSNNDLLLYPNPTNENHRFYGLLFNLIGEHKLTDLIQAYENFKTNGSNSIAGIKNLQRKLNLKLEKISQDFSNIYNVNVQKYRFELDLESDKVFFQIFEGNQSINLDKQSTGFKWFFNFYFNMYSGNGLKSGDLVVMDEPATNLHVSGQIELIKFIREFGKKNNILFVLSTHSPFLIDIDYLDELRIIDKDEIGTHITNKFNVIKDSNKKVRNSDLTAPIRSSLTISSNHLIQMNQIVVFVEGITDYGFLIAMRNKLSEANIDYQRLKFIPFDGVSDDKKNPKTNIHEIFNKITFKPIVLVDADAAGQDFATKNKNNLEVLTLKDIDSNFKEIEDLFDPQDKKDLNIESKKNPNALKLKNNPHLLNKLEKTTINNFNLLFKSLLN